MWMWMRTRQSHSAIDLRYRQNGCSGRTVVVVVMVVPSATVSFVVAAGVHTPGCTRAGGEPSLRRPRTFDPFRSGHHLGKSGAAERPGP
jgi:hypothetical protein